MRLERDNIKNEGGWCDKCGLGWGRKLERVKRDCTRAQSRGERGDGKAPRHRGRKKNVQTQQIKRNDSIFMIILKAPETSETFTLTFLTPRSATERSKNSRTGTYAAAL